jgi:glyoxylate reductase
MKPKILVTRAIFPQVIQYLSKHFDVEDNQDDAGYGDAELVQRLQGKAGVFANPTHRFTAELFTACPSLKAVCNMAVGYNNIDVPAATAAGVMVTNTPDVLNETTADFGWTLMMAAARRVSESEHYLRAGVWKKSHYLDFLGVDVHGSTLGVIGMGRIGQAIARRSMGFNMKVVYHNRTRLAPELEIAANHAQYLSRDEVLRTADHVILVLPYSPAVHHLIGAEQLALMKKGAVVVDMAAEQGGNCHGTKPGETVEIDGVRIFGAMNLPSKLAANASELFARNLLEFFKLVSPKGDMVFDLKDEIIAGCLICHQGEIRHAGA